MKKGIAVFLVLALLAGICPCALADWGSSDWGSSDTYTFSVTGSTNLYNASNAQLNNIELAVDKLNGLTVSYGQRFSFNETVGPRTAQYGYKSAINGRGVSVRGGGVAQVATTLYLALKQLPGIKFDRYITYGDNFTAGYVSDGDDAIVVDYSNKNDFSFRNNEGDIKIEMWTTRNFLYCTVSVDPKGDSSAALGNRVGYASIDLTGTNTLRNNVALAASRMNNTRLDHYSEFSFNHEVGPRTEANGFGIAVNGRGVKVVGGGVAQVATVVYLAVRNLSNVRITEKHFYGDRYNQTYVKNGDEAIVTDYKNGEDFCFQYRGYGTLTVVTYVNSSGSKLICEVYEKSGW